MWLVVHVDCGETHLAVYILTFKPVEPKELIPSPDEEPSSVRHAKDNTFVNSSVSWHRTRFSLNVLPSAEFTEGPI